MCKRIERESARIAVTIANGASASSEFDIRKFGLFAVLAPAGADGLETVLQVKGIDGGGWVDTTVVKTLATGLNEFVGSESVTIYPLDFCRFRLVSPAGSNITLNVLAKS